MEKDKILEIKQSIEVLIQRDYMKVISNDFLLDLFLDIHSLVSEHLSNAPVVEASNDLMDSLLQHNRFLKKEGFLKEFAEFILEDNLSEDASILDALEMFESYSEYEYQDYIDIEH